MGWRGSLRSITAEIRRYERDERRRLRELIRDEKESLVRQEQQQAAAIVERYEAHMAALTTVHRECGTRMKWSVLAATPDPPEPRAPPRPEPIDSASLCVAALEGYRPGWFSRVFGFAEKNRRDLAVAVEDARKADALANAEAAAKYAHDRDTRVAAHRRDCEAAADTRDLAAAVLKGDLGAYHAALQELDPFEELREVGVELDVSFDSAAVAVLALTAHERSVVPESQESLTARGKLSSKKMPKARGNEIYQDYVCGAALRACRELFAAVPIGWAIVTVRADMLDPVTGHVETQPVLSLLAPRRTIDGLSCEGLDPSDAMANFTCKMKFKRGTGMSRIEPLSAEDVTTIDLARAVRLDAS